MAQSTSSPKASGWQLKLGLAAIGVLVILAFGAADQAKNSGHPLFSLTWQK